MPHIGAMMVEVRIRWPRRFSAMISGCGQKKELTVFPEEADQSRFRSRLIVQFHSKTSNRRTTDQEPESVLISGF